MRPRRPRKRRFGNELERHRRRRLQDFAARAGGCEPDDTSRVYSHAALDQAYLPIHPFADEPEILARIGQSADRCLAVDAYWRTRDDARFVQVQSAAWARHPPQLEAWWWHDDPPWLHVLAIVAAPVITRALFEQVLARVATLDLAVPVGHRRRWSAL